jgi:hypothetical protein
MSTDELARRRRTIKLGWTPDPDLVDYLWDHVSANRQIAIFQEALDTGRGPTLGLRLDAFITGALVVGVAQRSTDFLLADIQRLLAELPEPYRTKMQLRPRGKPISYRQVVYTVRRLTSLPFIGTPTMSKRERDEAFREFIERAFLKINEPFIAESPVALTNEYACDSTFFETWARVRYIETATGERDRRTVDPDATEGHKPSKNGVPGGTGFGYDLHTATNIAPLGQPPTPSVIRAITLRPANTDYANSAVNVTRTLIDEVGTVDHVIVDRGYSMKRPEDLAIPLRELGVDRTIDLAAQDRTTSRGSHQGAVARDGTLFCPCAPDLDDIPSVQSSMNSAVKVELRKRYDERDHFKVGLRADAGDGYQRVECPARAGRVRCALVPASMRLDTTKPTVSRPPDKPDLICTQATITVAPTVVGRYAQRYSYGTTRHGESYDRRTAVERSNAYLETHYGHMRRGFIRVFGEAKHALLLALAVIAVNIHIVRAFTEIHNQPKRRAKRRTTA